MTSYELLIKPSFAPDGYIKVPVGHPATIGGSGAKPSPTILCRTKAEDKVRNFLGKKIFATIEMGQDLCCITTDMSMVVKVDGVYVSSSLPTVIMDLSDSRPRKLNIEAEKNQFEFDFHFQVAPVIPATFKMPAPRAPPAAPASPVMARVLNARASPAVARVAPASPVVARAAQPRPAAPAAPAAVLNLELPTYDAYDTWEKGMPCGGFAVDDQIHMIYKKEEESAVWQYASFAAGPVEIGRTYFPDSSNGQPFFSRKTVVVLNAECTQVKLPGKNGYAIDGVIVNGSEELVHDITPETQLNFLSAGVTYTAFLGTAAPVRPAAAVDDIQTQEFHEVNPGLDENTQDFNTTVIYSRRRAVDNEDIRPAKRQNAAAAPVVVEDPVPQENPAPQEAPASLPDPAPPAPPAADVSVAALVADSGAGPVDVSQASPVGESDGNAQDPLVRHAADGVEVVNLNTGIEAWDDTQALPGR